MRFQCFSPLICSSLLTLPLMSCSLIDEIPIGTGFAAKNICSGLYISGLDLDTLEQRFVAPQIKPLDKIWSVEVNEADKRVFVGDIIFGQRYGHTAQYRQGFGCTLLQRHSVADLQKQLPELLPAPVLPDSPWPQGHGGAGSPVQGVDYSALQKAVDQAFEENAVEGINTLAVAVVFQGKLLTEQYALGTTAQSPLIGWSMTKSFTSTLVGLLADQNRLNPKAPAPVPEWKDTDKADITLENLLHMAAGLEWSETSKGEHPDQGKMLFETDHFARYYAEKPPVTEPGTTFNYSTGATSLIGRIVQDAVGGTIADHYRFMQEALLHRINITSAVLEYDASGHPASGSNLYMTARDWARLGLLYERRGDWFGERILSENWMNYAITPSPANAHYGAQIWLNPDGQKWPSLPHDTYAFRGFQGQNTVIVPEHELVVVRMGVTFEEEGFALEELVASVIHSLPPKNVTLAGNKHNGHSQ